MASAEFQLAEFLPYRIAVLSERISRRLSLIYGAEAGISVGGRVISEDNVHPDEVEEFIIRWVAAD